MKLKANELEKITHNLSYLYERSTKAVSYCPPAYYADRLCERGRCYLAKYVSMRGRAPGARFDQGALDVPWRNGVHTKYVCPADYLTCQLVVLCTIELTTV